MAHHNSLAYTCWHLAGGDPLYALYLAVLVIRMVDQGCEVRPAWKHLRWVA